MAFWLGDVNVDEDYPTSSESGVFRLSLSLVPCREALPYKKNHFLLCLTYSLVAEGELSLFCHVLLVTKYLALKMCIILSSTCLTDLSMEQTGANKAVQVSFLFN